MRQVIFLFITIVLISQILFCQSNSIANVDDSGFTAESVQAVVTANNQLTFRLYRQLTNASPENHFFSPFSISTAMAMSYEGAKGDTASEMAKTLFLPTNPNIRRPGFARLMNQINNASGVKLNSANGLWADQTYHFLKEYVQVIQKRYSGKVTNLDFLNQPGPSRKIINDWVADHTNGKIKALLSPSHINNSTKLVLTNAVFFKGDWKTAFDKNYTRSAPFYVSKSKKVTAQMMTYREGHSFNYMENKYLQMIELPYQGDELSMTVLLPRKKYIQPILKRLSFKNYSRWKKELSSSEVKVILPKFQFKTKYDLIAPLQKMGIHQAFSGKANFSGMDGTQRLYISGVVHQAYVDVHEKGTEASAATGVTMNEKSRPRYPLFNANHPFIFMIEHKSTGIILFIGKVMIPSSQN